MFPSCVCWPQADGGPPLTAASELHVGFNVTLLGCIPTPLLFSRSCAYTHVPRVKGAHHYTGCGCGAVAWAGATVDWVWRADPGQRIQFSPGTFPHVRPGPVTALPSHELDRLSAIAVKRLVTWSASGVGSVLGLPSRPSALVPLRILYVIPHHGVTAGMSGTLYRAVVTNAVGSVPTAATTLTVGTAAAQTITFAQGPRCGPRGPDQRLFQSEAEQGAG